MVPTGIWPTSIALPGFTSTFLPATTLSPGEALRSEDVGLLAALIGDERDERRAVRVILETLDGCRDVPGATLEVDDPILCCAAGDATRGDMALVVAATRLALAFGQRLDRLALPQRDLSTRIRPRRAGLVGLYCLSAMI